MLPRAIAHVNSRLSSRRRVVREDGVANPLLLIFLSAVYLRIICAALLFVLCEVFSLAACLFLLPKNSKNGTHSACRFHFTKATQIE